MTRHTVLDQRQTDSSRLGAGGDSLRITGWDVEPHDSVQIDLGTPFRPTPQQPPQIRLRLTCPEDHTVPVTVGSVAALLQRRGRHVDGSGSIQAVPVSTEPGPAASGPSVQDRQLAPGESLVYTYDLVTDGTGSELPPVGAYKFETAVTEEEENGDVTVWLSR